MKFPRLSNSLQTSLIMSLLLYCKTFFIGSITSLFEFSIIFISYGSLLKSDPLNEPLKSTEGRFEPEF